MLHKQQKHNIPLGFGLILLSTIFYGSYGIWIKLIGDSFGVFMQGWIRALIVVALFIGLMLIQHKRWEPIRWAQDWRWLVFAIVGNGLIAGPTFYATVTIGIGSATLLLYGGYLLSMFYFGWLLNKERYTKSKLLSSVLAIAGLYCVFSFSFSTDQWLAYVAALAGGIGTGIDMTVSKHIRYSTTQTTIIAWGTGIVSMAPISLLLGEHIAPLSDQVAWLALIGFVAVNMIASWTSIAGVKLVESGITGILGLLEIVWAIAFGILLFHEQLHLLTLLGAVLLVLAAALPYLETNERPIESAPI